MDSDASGWLWLVIDVAMVAVLAIALAYGTVLWRRRSRALAQASERATAQLYEREAEHERKAEANRAPVKAVRSGTSVRGRRNVATGRLTIKIENMEAI
jgi:hypothetical protein